MIQTFQSTGGHVGFSDGLHSGSMSARYGQTVEFSITPAIGYEVKQVYLDGNPVGAVTSLSISVSTEHKVWAEFQKKIVRKKN